MEDLEKKEKGILELIASKKTQLKNRFDNASRLKESITNETKTENENDNDSENKKENENANENNKHLKHNEQIEVLDDASFLLGRLENEKKQHEKLKMLHHNLLKDQRNWNKSIEEFKEQLRHGLSVNEQMLNVKLAQLQEEWRDISTHLKTQQKCKASMKDEEIDNASFRLQQGKSKNNYKRDLKQKGISGKKHKKQNKKLNKNPKSSEDK
ncbi:hypothetical protein RFI_14838 [Reticulomyxa filosa]|uniref:Uncharacterized protein n=1 Tax=Reticulomyxa filosa TaxID=46433 RepID=X6N9F7_RETFI|nr:hypothetical protein RFI_14838 [Reticulomyxa filosa]|eukprot:ETO22364.1 hypothetical protein RFI_14838 [Reticulomyxa filosa]